MRRSRSSARSWRRWRSKARTGNSMKTVVVILVLGGVVLGGVVRLAHATEYLQTLKEGSWLCTTPEAYDLAIAEQRKLESDLEALKERLLAQKLWIYADAAFVEKMMVPYAKVLERQGNKVKVTLVAVPTAEGARVALAAGGVQARRGPARPEGTVEISGAWETASGFLNGQRVFEPPRGHQFHG